MKITIVGIGYVGLSLAVLLSQNNEVTALDISAEKIELLNRKKSPIADADIDLYLSSKKLTLKATDNPAIAYKNADMVIISTPTTFDDIKKQFDTSIVEKNIKQIIKFNSKATIVIRSTVPIGFTKRMQTQFSCNDIIFSPEFLREGQALHDNLYPSRIIVGTPENRDVKRNVAKEFVDILMENVLKKGVSIAYMNSDEAEAVKLFSNTYLAMRVSFFNEIDTFASENNLDIKSIIDGMGLDERIGRYYNNPSFGYGGYCLPKDSKQLLSQYKDIPQSLITAVVESNTKRKNYVVEQI